MAITGTSTLAPALDGWGLREEAIPLTARTVCSPQTVGKCSGDWVPFGRGRDQAGDYAQNFLGFVQLACLVVLFRRF
jgi:hypothetical protein